MGRRPGTCSLTDPERLEIRWRVARGERPAEVAAAVGRTERLVRYVLARAGGLPPRPTTRSPLRLSKDEREEISRGLGGGETLRSIAGRLGRQPSTVSRGGAANGGRRGRRGWA